MSQLFLYLVAITLTLSGCVSSQTHKATLKELENSRQQYIKSQQDLEQLHQETNQTRLQLDEARQEVIDLEIRKQDLLIAMQKFDIELEEVNHQLAMIKELETETQRRNEIYAQFVQRLQPMIDGKQLSVKIESGRLVIHLPNNILFQSGHAKLNRQGEKALNQVASILTQLDERHFQVEGHTDNEPIKSSQYPSNWELSAARAMAVVHLLIKSGVPPQHLSAAGFGEYKPRANNDTAAGRRRNRRIEIVMLPNLEVLSNEIPVTSVDRDRSK